MWRARSEMKNGRCSSDYLIRPFSENLDSLPESWRRLEGATSRRGFLPASPTDDFDFARSAPASYRRTKLLTPSVFSAGIQGLVNCNDRVQHYAGQQLVSMHCSCFSTRKLEAVNLCG